MNTRCANSASLGRQLLLCRRVVSQTTALDRSSQRSSHVPEVGSGEMYGAFGGPHGKVSVHDSQHRECTIVNSIQGALTWRFLGTKRVYAMSSSSRFFVW